jgi:hypothetical protein
MLNSQQRSKALRKPKGIMKKILKIRIGDLRRSADIKNEGCAIIRPGNPLNDIPKVSLHNLPSLN